MWQSVRDVWLEFNEPLEGRLNFMYLDIRGLVTTGVGNLIDPRELAEELPWETADGSVAAPEQIDAEWDQIKSKLDQAKLGGGTFKRFATLFLPDAEIDRLVFNKLDEMERLLKSRPDFADFDEFPADGQLGLLSMSWAMGPLFKFPKFQSFIADGRWNDAVAECRFQPDSGTIKLRNDRDELLFQNAAAVADPAFGLDPAAVIWPSTP
jgi:hypothetical protein